MKSSDFLIVKAHLCVNPRRLNHFFAKIGWGLATRVVEAGKKFGSYRVYNFSNVHRKWTIFWHY